MSSDSVKYNNEATDFLGVLRHSLKQAAFYIFVFSAAINILLLMLPIYSLQVFDRVLSSGSISTLTALTLIALFCFVLYSVLNSVREYILIKISAWLGEKLNDRIFRLAVNHSSLTGQRMNSQIISEANNVKNFVTSPQVFSLFDLPWSIVFIFVIYMISPEISLLVIFGTAILFALTYLKEFRAKSQLKEITDINHQNMLKGDEIIRYAEVIEAMGMLPDTYGIWKTEYSGIAQHNQAISFLSSQLNSIAKFLRMVLQIGIIALGTYLALNKQMTFGGIIACSILAGKAMGPFDAIMSLWSTYGKFLDSYNSLKTFLNSAAERPVVTNVGQPKGDIEAEKIIFLNPKNKNPIIKGISLKINSGDVIGVIGPSGSGKSTLIKLLAGIYKPTNGVVRIDKGDLFNRNRDDIGKYLGYLPQSIDLMRGTVKQNISRFNPDVSDDAVIAAAKKTEVHELIMGLPQGYDTLIGEGGGVELSGGQKQRIGLARAFYGDPRIIFLDEPNSNLDGAGEMVLLKAVVEAKNEGKTVIMIGHKPSVINIVSKVIVIQNGVVTDYGSKDEVMKKFAKN
jgi:ATP-binding cassette subfamily B protein